MNNTYIHSFDAVLMLSRIHVVEFFCIILAFHELNWVFVRTTLIAFFIKTVGETRVVVERNEKK